MSDLHLPDPLSGDLGGYDLGRAIPPDIGMSLIAVDSWLCAESQEDSHVVILEVGER